MLSPTCRTRSRSTPSRRQASSKMRASGLATLTSSDEMTCSKCRASCNAPQNPPSPRCQLDTTMSGEPAARKRGLDLWKNDEAVGPENPPDRQRVLSAVSVVPNVQAPEQRFRETLAEL